MIDYRDVFVEKMKSDGLPQLVIDTFLHYYEMLTSGETGCIHESDIIPIARGDLPAISSNGTLSETGKAVLDKAAVLKLNGGLGTTMGLDGPKCLLKVKDDKSFLDLIVAQLNALRLKTGVRVPLVLMNSFNTDEDTRNYLKKCEVPDESLPKMFLQHKFPKVTQSDFSPAHWAANPKQEWNPPGHGNLYTAIVTSGMLDELLDQGLRYLFVSNVDNVGALLDLDILGYFAQSKAPFMMEVIQRTPMDRKGGHLAKYPNGQLLLREIAQTREEDLEQFGDIDRHGYFNTNNLWIDLRYLKSKMSESSGVLDLPMIRNAKNLIPKNTTTPKIFQIETAMGSAIALFPKSIAASVPNCRYRPVKRCDDLLLLWSDCYQLNESGDLRRSAGEGQEMVTINLDQECYGTYLDLEKFFPDGPPSLKAAHSLTIEGPVIFGRNIKIEGNAHVINRSLAPAKIADDTKIAGRIEL